MIVRDALRCSSPVLALAFCTSCLLGAHGCSGSRLHACNTFYLVVDLGPDMPRSQCGFCESVANKVPEAPGA